MQLRFAISAGFVGLTMLVVGIDVVEYTAQAKPRKRKTENSTSNETPAPSKEVENWFICPEQRPEPPEVDRKDVYKGAVYQPGEVAEYEVRYGGALVGRGSLEVRKPYRHKGSYKRPLWHRSFHAEAKTGDWYKYIFVAKDSLDSLVRPHDQAVSRFYMEQDEGQLFGKRLQQKKWLDFDQENCKTNERVEKVGKKPKENTYDLSFGAKDTLGVAYWMRDQTYEIGKPIRVMVYSSEKNWWLELNPLAFEDIEIGEVKYKKAVRMKLKSYIGKEMQQRGDVDVWIDTQTKDRPLLQIVGEIKIGSIRVELVKFTPGQP